MTTTNVYFDGGSKDGTTRVEPAFEGDLAFENGLWDKEELYRRTDEQRTIDGVTYTVFRYDGRIPTIG